MPASSLCRTGLFLAGALIPIGIAAAQAPLCLSEQKISSTTGGFGGALDATDLLGFSSAGLGDLDGDGVGDMIVGAPGDDDGGVQRGAVWILFMNADGTVKHEQKISSTQGYFNSGLEDGDQFGYAVAALGDINGDGAVDAAVGAPFDDDGSG